MDSSPWRAVACTQTDSPGGSTGPGAESDIYDCLVGECVDVEVVRCACMCVCVCVVGYTGSSSLYPGVQMIANSPADFSPLFPPPPPASASLSSSSSWSSRDDGLLVDRVKSEEVGLHRVILSCPGGGAIYKISYDLS